MTFLASSTHRSDRSDHPDRSVVLPDTLSVRPLAILFGWLAGGIAQALGLMVLIGWAIGSEPLKSVLPGLVTMKPNTALAFICCGVSLWSHLQRERYHYAAWLGGILAAFVALLGALTLSQDVLAISLGIDQWLFQEPKGVAFTGEPGRMSPLTAFNFIALGSALVGLHCQRAVYWVQALSIAALLVSLFSLSCYFFGSLWFEQPPFPRWLQRYTQMAVHTTLMFMLLSAGILGMVAQHGWLARLGDRLTSVAMWGAGGLILAAGSSVMLTLLEHHSTSVELTNLLLASMLTTSLSVLVITLVYWHLREQIAERRRVEESLRLASLVFENSREAMFVTDAEGTILRVNPAFCAMTGFSAEEAIGQTPRILKSNKQNAAFYQSMWRALKNLGYWQGEIWNRRKNGELYAEWLSINSIRDARGTIQRYVALFTDITQEKENARKIWHQANFDPLTDLPNRFMLGDRLDQALLKAQRQQQSLAVLFIDLDHFKEINDTMGHHAGDALLREAAERIQSVVRESDTVARWGGDEFIVVLNALNGPEPVGRIAEQILAQFNVPFTLAGRSVHVSASIGISLFPQDARNAEQMLAFADQAMYSAKQMGRNRYCYFAASMQTNAKARMALLEDLRQAMAAGQLHVYYQPIVDLRTGAIYKAEALLRWQHPVRGWVSPSEFIPLAEESGLIVDIGHWVFREVVAQLAAWQAHLHPEFQIAVNKSPAQFDERSSCENDWTNYLQQQGLAGKSVVVEITEGLMLHGVANTFNKLLEFRNAGMQVAIDDFGTGYSSLAYLKRFDIDYLKIDRSFTSQIAPGNDELALCEAIVVMAHKLGLQVIAEGVETAQQWALLCAMGCDYAQGFLFARPQPADVFVANWPHWHFVPPCSAVTTDDMVRWPEAIRAIFQPHTNDGKR